MSPTASIPTLRNPFNDNENGNAPSCHNLNTLPPEIQVQIFGYLFSDPQPPDFYSDFQPPDFYSKKSKQKDPETNGKYGRYVNYFSPRLINKNLDAVAKQALRNTKDLVHVTSNWKLLAKTLFLHGIPIVVWHKHTTPRYSYLNPVRRMMWLHIRVPSAETLSRPLADLSGVPISLLMRIADMENLTKAVRVQSLSLQHCPVGTRPAGFDVPGVPKCHMSMHTSGFPRIAMLIWFNKPGDTGVIALHHGEQQNMLELFKALNPVGHIWVEGRPSSILPGHGFRAFNADQETAWQYEQAFIKWSNQCIRLDAQDYGRYLQWILGSADHAFRDRQPKKAWLRADQALTLISRARDRKAHILAAQNEVLKPELEVLTTRGRLLQTRCLRELDRRYHATRNHDPHQPSFSPFDLEDSWYKAAERTPLTTGLRSLSHDFGSLGAGSSLTHEEVEMIYQSGRPLQAYVRTRPIT